MRDAKAAPPSRGDATGKTGVDMGLRPTHEAITELLPGYALGALDEDEERFVARHLDDCPVCRLQLDELRETAGLLAFGAPPAQPSPGAKAALFARVAAAEGAARPTVTNLAPPAQPHPRERGASVRTRARSARSRFAWPRPAPARLAPLALAAAVILSLLGWNISLQRRLDDAARLAALAPSDAERELIVRLLNNPAAAHSLRPVGEDDYGGGVRTAGFVYADPAYNVALLLTYWMPPLRSDQRYQVWLILPDGSRDSGGLFSVDERGNGQLLVRAPAPFARYQAVGISPEPYDGSPRPTAPGVVRGDLR